MKVIYLFLLIIFSSSAYANAGFAKPDSPFTVIKSLGFECYVLQNRYSISNTADFLSLHRRQEIPNFGPALPTDFEHGRRYYHTDTNGNTTLSVSGINFPLRIMEDYGHFNFYKNFSIVNKKKMHFAFQFGASYSMSSTFLGKFITETHDRDSLRSYDLYRFTDTSHEISFYHKVHRIGLHFGGEFSYNITRRFSLASGIRFSIYVPLSDQTIVSYYGYHGWSKYYYSPGRIWHESPFPVIPNPFNYDTPNGQFYAIMYRKIQLLSDMNFYIKPTFRLFKKNTVYFLLGFNSYLNYATQTHKAFFNGAMYGLGFSRKIEPK
ncbi:MAG: hypothetical protein KG003_02385 [Bacteroidetes bacterium]|nr:hypothetical protein [Bacteroidota bacterium]